VKLWSNKYHMLISSLPPLPSRFDVDRLPISPERLQSRLLMLKPKDAIEIKHMLDVLCWSRQFDEPEDAAVVKKYGELMQHVTNPLIREVLTAAMDVRMITTALRSRRLGLGPPRFGMGSWFARIRRRFDQPAFTLEHVFPALGRFVDLFERGDVLNIYRGLLDVTWRYLKRRADDYYFSFEAVVLYIARWEIIQHWQGLRADRGRTAFETLVKEALGEDDSINP
jgi:hypothetical protein